jgi:hypothetical protein
MASVERDLHGLTDEERAAVSEALRANAVEHTWAGARLAAAAGSAAIVDGILDHVRPPATGHGHLGGVVDAMASLATHVPDGLLSTVKDTAVDILVDVVIDTVVDAIGDAL